MSNLTVIAFHERDVIMRSCDGCFSIYRPLVHKPDVVTVMQKEDGSVGEVWRHTGVQQV